MLMIWKTRLTREEAIQMASENWHEGKTPREIVEFQLFEERLCMPLEVFQSALEAVLGRPVQTFEFSPKGWEALQKEFLSIQ